jgi:hypothetical protein
VLRRIDSNVKSEAVVNGSLVKTNQGWIYISIPLGKIVVDGESVMCLSAQSPLGREIVGKRAGDTVVVNNSSFGLEAVA